MTCADVGQLLDAFLDAELPAPMLLEVARHAAACPECEGAVRELTSIRDAVERTVRAEAEALDLGRVWPAVAAA
ncbi:MAG TPA: zf-HC2 domain-containing protein, partial [Gaiellaceae bacterium]|nr:zf-HC2 domain-containing protein [Gaiellaceae bacterium]